MGQQREEHCTGKCRKQNVLSFLSSPFELPPAVLGARRGKGVRFTKSRESRFFVHLRNSSEIQKNTKKDCLPGNSCLDFMTYGKLHTAGIFERRFW
jgi:hypothetical protein